MSGRKRHRGSGGSSSSQGRNDSNSSPRYQYDHRSPSSAVKARDYQHGDQDLVDRTIVVNNVPDAMTPAALANFLTGRLKKYRLIKEHQSPVLSCLDGQRPKSMVLRMDSVGSVIHVLKLNGIDSMQLGHPLEIFRHWNFLPKTIRDKEAEVQDYEETKAAYEGDLRYVCIRDFTSKPSKRQLLDFLNKAASVAGLIDGVDSGFLSCRFATTVTRADLYIVAKARDQRTASALLNLNGITFMGDRLRVHLKGSDPSKNKLLWRDLKLKEPDMNETHSHTMEDDIEHTKARKVVDDDTRSESDMSISDSDCSGGTIGIDRDETRESSTQSPLKSEELFSSKSSSPHPSGDNPPEARVSISSTTEEDPPSLDELEEAQRLLCLAEEQVAKLESIHTMVADEVSRHPGEPLSPTAEIAAESVIGNSNSGESTTPLEDIYALLEQARQVARDRKEDLEKLKARQPMNTQKSGSKAMLGFRSKEVEKDVGNTIPEQDEMLKSTIALDATEKQSLSEITGSFEVANGSAETLITKDDFQTLLARVQSKDQALKVAQADLFKLQEKVKNLTEANQAKEILLAKDRSRADKIEANHKMLEDDNSDEVDTHNSVKTLRDENARLRKEIGLLQASRKEQQVEYDSLKDIADAKEEVIIEIQGENTKLQNEVKSLRKMLVVKDENVCVEKKKAEDYQKKNDALKESLDSTQKNLDDAQGLISRLHEQNRSLRGQEGSLLEQERKKTEDYKKKYHDAVFEFTTSENERRKAVNDLLVQKTVVTNLEDGVDDEKAKRREAESKLKKLEKTLRDLQSKSNAGRNGRISGIVKEEAPRM